MDLKRALEIVLELAQGNVIEDDEMEDQREEQEEAISIVSRMVEPTAVVILSGGVVQSVSTDNPVNVIVLDYDQDGVTDEDAKIDKTLHKVDGKYLAVIDHTNWSLSNLMEENREMIPLINSVYPDNEPRFVKAQYVSQWDNGTSVTTACLYDTVSKFCFAIESSDVDMGESTLDREYVELADGTELDESDGVTFDY